MDEEKKTPEVSENAFPENFPTSARPIFRALILLAMTVALLCYVAYQCSEHPQDAANQQRIEKKEAQKASLLSDEEEEETEE